jgi:hypothetical protein
VFLKEVATGTILLVSRSSGGSLGNADSSGSGSGLRPALADFARSVSFVTNATNLAAETGGTWPTVVTHDPRTGATRGYSTQAIEGQPGVSAGGTFLATYSGSALDPAYAIRGMFLFAAEGDEDGDGIPNPVEFAEGRNPAVKDNDIFSPGSGSARLFAMQQYRDFLGREGDAAGIQGWAGLVTAGTYSRAQVIDAFVNSAEFGGFVAPVVRLYFATFLRVPDYAGLAGNAALVRNGAVSLLQLADFFVASPEFAATYGALDNTAFVTLLYNNVLGRAPDPAGLSGWVGLLNGGMSRGQVLLGFSDSAEYQAAMAREVLVTMMYTAMLRRTPEPSGFNGWVAFLDAGTYTREQVINGFFLSTEYRARFLP